MWNSCENWTINQPALPTSSGLKPSCCSKCECNVILVWFFSFVLIFSKLSTRNFEEVGVEDVIIQGSEIFWGRARPWTITPSPLALTMECSSELYMNVSSIKRLDSTFWNFVLKIFAKFVICFLLFSFLPKGTFLRLNWYMCAMRTYMYICLTYCACIPVQIVLYYI